MKPYYQRAGWRWLPGMAYRWAGSDDRVQDTEPGEIRKDGSCVPSLDDPATQGAALAVLREVTGEPGLSFARAGLAGDATGGRWYMIASRRLADATTSIDAATEAAALLAALDRLIPE